MWWQYLLIAFILVVISLIIVKLNKNEPVELLVYITDKSYVQGNSISINYIDSKTLKETTITISDIFDLYGFVNSEFGLLYPSKYVITGIWIVTTDAPNDLYASNGYTIFNV